MAYEKEYTYDGGTNGSNITTTDTGSGDHWDTITKVSGTVKYSNATRSANSVMCGEHITSLVTNDYAVTLWSTGISGSTQYIRLYVKISASPGDAQSTLLGYVLNSALSAITCKVVINASRQIELQDSTLTTRATSSTVLSTGTWYRVESKVVAAASGSIECRIFPNYESRVPAEDFSATSINTNTAPGAMYVGIYSAPSESLTMDIDDVAIDTAGWIGAKYPIDDAKIVGSGVSQSSDEMGIGQAVIGRSFSW